MRFRTSQHLRREENLVPLIDIAFLILIFFLIASTIKPFSDREIKLAEIDAPSGSAASPHMLIIRSDGVRLIGGQALSDSDLGMRLAKWSQGGDLPLTIIADRNVKAGQLVDVVTRASAAGIKNVKLLTRRVRR